MSKNGVSRISNRKHLPSPKVSGIIQASEVWKETVEELQAGREVSITIPGPLRAKLIKPEDAFLSALRRWNKANGDRYKVYARKGIIYAVRNVSVLQTEAPEATGK